MFRVIKLKSFLIILGVIMLSIILGVGVVKVITIDAIPRYIYTIVLDAGHGGRDDGCSGVNGTKESEINLAITKKLKMYLEDLGVRVVLTRADGNGLYKSNVDNYKQSDMEERVKIIAKANPDLVVSIHCNSYADSSVSGAQAYYHEGDEIGKEFATAMQSQMISILDNARSEIGKGDYYLLKETSSPAVIVEAGYLSNVNDEKNLQDEAYQNRVAYAIMCGIVKYYNLCGND